MMRQFREWRATRRTAAGLGVAALAAALMIALMAPGRLTFAHAQPQRANPAAGSTIPAAPAKVEMWFTEEVNPDGTVLNVTGPNGEQVDQGDTALDLYDVSHEHVTVTLKPNLGPGVYTVTWQSVSAEDGDAANGTFTFTVTGSACASASPIASPMATPSASPAPAAPCAATPVAPAASPSATP
jgi:methionine-rich copper-binding protein CopC